MKYKVWNYFIMVSKSIFSALIFLNFISWHSTYETVILYVVSNVLLPLPQVRESVNDDTRDYLNDENEHYEVEHLVESHSAVVDAVELFLVPPHSIWQVFIITINTSLCVVGLIYESTNTTIILERLIYYYQVTLQQWPSAVKVWELIKQETKGHKCKHINHSKEQK